MHIAAVVRLTPADVSTDFLYTEEIDFKPRSPCSRIMICQTEWGEGRGSGL